VLAIAYTDAPQVLQGKQESLVITLIRDSVEVCMCEHLLFDKQLGMRNLAGEAQIFQCEVMHAKNI